MKEIHYSASYIYMNMMSGYLSRGGFKSLQNIASEANIPIAERGRVPLTNMLTLVDLIASATRNRAFGLDIGIQMHPSEYGLISHAFMNCDNLHEVMNLSIRYTHLINDAFTLSIEKQNEDEVTIVLLSENELQAMVPLVELEFASILTITRFLVGDKNADNIRLLEICFQHPPQTMPEHYTKHFKCTVRFNQPANTIRVCSPDPYIYRYLLKKIEEIAERLQINIPLSKRVFNYVVKQLPDGMPSISQAATKFNMSPSTLKKHLNQEDANFTEICDTVRKNIAVKMISVKQKSLKEIGNHLGFSNSSTFNRAFKRWTNMSPTEYRQKANNKEPAIKSDHQEEMIET
jgi:AraC-like DNA-binding protein